MLVVVGVCLLLLLYSWRLLRMCVCCDWLVCEVVVVV